MIFGAFVERKLISCRVCSSFQLDFTERLNVADLEKVITCCLPLIIIIFNVIIVDSLKERNSLNLTWDDDI